MQYLPIPINTQHLASMTLVGETVLHYEITEQLGSGGMGVVYKARDTRLDRLVALKFLPAEMSRDPEANQRFMQEARAASALEHSNICTVYDIGRTDDDRLFIVMPFYAGQTLKYRILDGSQSVEKSVEVAIQIARGLARAHEAGIVHRDIKPANIMVTDRGEVKILDFGVAKLEKGIDLTRTGATLGTVPYMSPEQIRGEPIDGRSDLWSLGVVLFEMITGRKPFVGDYDQAVAYSILNSEPEALSDSGRQVPQHVVDAVGQLLQKSPGDRIQTASQVATMLSGEDTGVISQPEPSSRSAGRTAAIAATAGALVLALLFLVSTWPDAKQPTSDEPDTGAKLAVLPFSNLRSDPETDFLGYALADQVIGSLAYVKNLTVRPSSSVRNYQYGEYDLDEVSENLAVNFVLAGNYLQQGDRMRLTVELIDLGTKKTVWREPINIAYQDAFEMQDLVSERLLSRLEISFSEHERARMRANVSRNPLAYEYYLRSLSHPEDAPGNALGVSLLRQSIELDSTFAPAWDALGRRVHLMGYWELAGEEASNQARRYYLKALEINPELFSALAHLTMLETDFGETDRAMESALQTLEINPNSAEGHFAYGYVLRYAGLIEESAAAMDAALEIDPTNPVFRSAGYTYMVNDRYDDAIAAFYLGTAELAVAWEGEVAVRQGRPDLAREKLNAAIAVDPEGIVGLWSIGVLSALEGDYERGIEAARKWEEANLSDGEGWFYLAGIYCINKATQKCISLLEVAVDRGYFCYPNLLKTRFLDEARGNPEFDAVLEKARLRHEAFKEEFFPLVGAQSDLKPHRFTAMPTSITFV